MIAIGDRVRLSGGYEPEVEGSWLHGKGSVMGTALKWIPGQNQTEALVVVLDDAITATGTTKPSATVTVAGRYVVLELRYVGQEWSDDGIVHVELCDFEPTAVRWQDREQVGAWVESHAEYSRVVR